MKLNLIAALAIAFSVGNAKLSDKVNKKIDEVAADVKSWVGNVIDKVTDHVEDKRHDIKDRVDSFVEEHEGEFKDIADALKKFPDQLKDVNDNVDLAVEWFDRQADKYESVNGLLPIRNATCVTLHCSGYTAGCLADSVCRSNLMCEKDCGMDDFFCQFTCTQSYMSKAFDDMFSCLFVDPACLALPDPLPINNATCRDHTPVSSIDTAALEGTWYVLQGFNPVYDCFECQQETFKFNADGQVDYDAMFNLAASNGTEIWPTAHMTGNITGGTVELYGFDHGLPDHQSWSVMYQSDDTLVTYYCGDVLDQWHFEGLIVMSRDGNFNEARTDDVQAVFDQLNIKASDMCPLNPKGKCPGLSDAPAALFEQ